MKMLRRVKHLRLELMESSYISALREIINKFEGKVEMNQWHYIKTDKLMATNVPGVFAAGDIRDKVYRQAVLAAADGAIAGIEAEKYLVKQSAKG